MDTGAVNPGFDDITGEASTNNDDITGKETPSFDDITAEQEPGLQDDPPSSSDNDDISSDGFDQSSVAEDTETEISEADIGENEINVNKKVSFKDGKDGSEPKQTLFAKLETFRKPYFSVLGKRFTCYNIRYFVAVFSLIVFLRSCVGSYLHMVSYEVGRRYYNNRYEMDFITGVERIGVVLTLIFSSYYGNKFFKPISILCGAVICGIGAIVSAVPYFMLKERESDRVTSIPNYIEAGLCGAGSNTNTSFSEQCMEHPALSLPQENKGSFSLFCMAHFLIGVGTAFLIPGGIVYTVEAERSEENPLYIGLFLGSYGLGQLIGSLFGFWFISYPENMTGELAIFDWHIGAWWLGFVVFGSLLIVMPFALLAFPRWIREPKWLLYRKYRHKLRLDRWKKREQEARRERRRKKREKLKKERERKKIKERNKQVAAKKEDNHVENDSAEISAKAVDEGANTKEEENVYLELNSETKDEAIKDETGNDNKGDDDPLTDVNLSNGTSYSGENIPVNDAKEANGVSGTENGMAPSSIERKPLYKKHSQGKQVRISQASEVTEKQDKTETAEEEMTPAELKRKRTMDKNMQRYKLGRQIQDLPKNLKFLVKRPLFLVTVLGAAVSMYFQTGFYPTLHRYFHVQFQYSYRDSTMIAGVVFGLGILLGALVSSLVIFRFRLPLRRQFLVCLVIQGLTLIMVMILMALGCELQQADVQQTELGIQSSCATSCDCSVSQFSRVCSRDGSMSYVSPCHAGCTLTHVDSNHLHYTGCVCETSQEVAPEWCYTRCPSAAGFIICCLVAVVTQSMAFVTIILIMIQSHPEKLRSLNLGFSFWIIYIIAAVPGVAVYTYFFTASCTLYGINCHEDDECWSADVTQYRYITAGATLAFLAVGLAILIGAFFVFRKVNKPKPSTINRTPSSSKNSVNLKKDTEKVDVSSRASNGASNSGAEQEQTV